jgi:hypothetical protein
LEGLREQSANEKFPLKNVLKRIHKDEEVLRFCRAAIEDEASVHNGLSF